MSEKQIIKVKNLTKKYDDLTAVDHINFEVKHKEIFGILGPNGAGKTTTLEMIEGIKEIGEGQAIIDGINVAKHPNKVKELIGIQLQSSSYFDNLNVKELLKLFGSFYHKDIDAEEIISKVQLEGKGKSEVDELSGGQKQRLSIASALVNNPKVLFLDEPTTGLDPQARRNLWTLIKNLRDNDSKTIVLTTHYMEEAEELCDRVAIMDEGKIIKMDTPENLINNLLDRGFKPHKQVMQATLEDVFLDLTGKELRE
jgi:ABC-2 type transport system ATP-binding protein